MANAFTKAIRWLVGADEQRQWNDTENAAWWSPVGPGGVHVTEDTALNFSAVWACETLIADSIATLPVDTYRKSGKRRIETEPPRWLEQPNEYCDRVDHDTQRLLSLLGWGNSYEWLYRTAADSLASVVAREVIEPWRVSVRQEGGTHRYYIDGIEKPSAFIQHIAAYRLPGSLVGIGPVTKARESLRIGLQADAFAAEFIQNGIFPSGALEVPQLPADVSADVVERLRDNVIQWYGGSRNAGKPLVLTGGTTWKQMTLTPSDAQFLESRMFQIEEIARWFRVPLHKIQHITDNASQGGGNGLEQMDLEFARDTLLRWAVRLERADSKLLPRGQYVRYNLDAYARADLRARTEALQIRRQNGALNADEWRALEDNEPIGGRAGSVYWMPVNMVDADEETPDPVPAPAPVAVGATEDE